MDAGGGRAPSPSAPVNTGLLRMDSRFSALWKGGAALEELPRLWERGSSDLLGRRQEPSVGRLLAPVAWLFLRVPGNPRTAGRSVCVGPGAG